MKTLMIAICVLLSAGLTHADPFYVNPFKCAWWDNADDDWHCHTSLVFESTNTQLSLGSVIDTSDTLFSLGDIYPDPMSLTFAESGRKFADFSINEQTITIYLKSIMEEGYKLIIEEGK